MTLPQLKNLPGHRFDTVVYQNIANSDRMRLQVAHWHYLLLQLGIEVLSPTLSLMRSLMLPTPRLMQQSRTH